MNLRIQELVAAGESRTVEFKTARRGLNRNLYETICAFLNRDGGDILLGVLDDGTVQGVDPEMIEGDVFTIIVKCPDFDGQPPEDTLGKTSKPSEKLSEKPSEKTSEKVSEKTSEKIVKLMRDNAEITAAEMAHIIGISSRAVEMQIKNLKTSERIRRKGPDKGGHWEVLS